LNEQTVQKRAFLLLNRDAAKRRNPLIYSRWPLFITRAITLAGFVLTIFAGLFGSVVGSQNFAIIFVWIAWWTALKLLFIPLGGRSWCAVCPIPMPGEWISQGGIFPGGKKIGLGRKWPKQLKFGRLGSLNLRGAWLQSGGFLMIGLFSAMTLTTPALTGWVLLGIIVLSLLLSLVFEKRAFCNHLCPIGGFTGLYAQAAPVEIRVKDRAICAAHTEKTCYQNCPWGVYVTALQDNGPCGMCMECIRVCPHDNVSINLREFGKDFIETRKSPRLDEAFLALVMLGCVMAFSAVFLGPWGALRRAAYEVGSTEWLVYAAGFLLFAVLLIPGLYALLLRLGGPVEKVGKSIARFSRPLLPLGLATWIAFTISFSFAKVSYVLPILSDPFGRGWNLFGTANIVWSPDVSSLSPILQTVVLLGGLLWMGKVARKEADTSRRAAFLQSFGFLITLGMFLLLVG
jgi:polyferredoxin